MVGAAQGIGRWKVIWPLVLLALAVRIGLGASSLPWTVADDPVARLAQVSVLCDGHHPGPDAPLPHHPADAGEGVLLLFADVLATPDLRAGPVACFGTLIVATAPTWCFPPVRGPPPRRAAALYAQGPPALI